MLNQIGAEWPANCAGEATEQRHAGNRPPRAPAVNAPERRESCIVKPRAHADAEDSPPKKVPCKVLRRTDEEEAG